MKYATRNLYRLALYISLLAILMHEYKIQVFERDYTSGLIMLGLITLIGIIIAILETTNEE